MYLKTLVGYIFAASSMGLSSFEFPWRAPKDARLAYSRVGIDASRSSKVDDFRAI